MSNSLLRFFLVSAAVLLYPGCTQEGPRIVEIYPRIGMMGEALTISGENFGDEQDESYVTIAGSAPTSSSYVEWRDDRIVFRVPEFGESGLVYVHRGAKKSNPALFSNQAAIPEPVSPEQAGIGPQILSVTPASGAIGQLVSIAGNNFGASRESGGVYFAWGAETPASAPAGIGGPAWVEVFDGDLGYELWSEREIRVRVPDGAVSGGLEVRTLRGESSPQFFEVTGKPGTKVYREKRSYALSYSVNILVREASSSNILYLWVPQPVVSASQRNPEILSRSLDPYIENYRGVSLYRLRDLKSDSTTGITLFYAVEVYAVETNLNPSQIRIPRQDAPSSMAAVYTEPSSLIPSDDSEVTRQSQAITGREQNPYLKARRIYEWLIENGNIQWNALSGNARDALLENQADPYMAALLFCALARAAGIPARPSAGVLVDKAQNAFRHFWAEFWIDGAGWIPVDPALGAGAAPPAFTVRQDHAAYYFGSLDCQRITFSRGQVSLSRMDPRGRTTARERDYALQSLWEEAAGGLESYSSLWSDVTINGVYLQ
ncbi:MAG: IPT/TIG domain-containing protein [Spirochaetaceae bacterium]|jgi:transglutaminase-like putative cysteine protease|nr:IPT/TIG domain-containing protein [Spirochaetaceae bacterium]